MYFIAAYCILLPHFIWGNESSALGLLTSGKEKLHSRHQACNILLLVDNGLLLLSLVSRLTERPGLHMARQWSTK